MSARETHGRRDVERAGVRSRLAPNGLAETSSDDDLAPENYNFDHFQSRHLLADGYRTLISQGVRPGRTAPDFELPRVGGGAQRLSFMRGKPIVLHFGSFT
jgi:hypothetical protein